MHGVSKCTLNSLKELGVLVAIIIRDESLYC